MQTERHEPFISIHQTDTADASCNLACDSHHRTIAENRDTGFALKPPGWMILVAGLLSICVLPGCGYVIGQDFNRDIKTVSVPIFENDTNRRGIEFQLTEAVQSEITKRTPYRLAKGLQADTRLTGRIVGFRKDVLGETRNDDPRELQLTLMVKVTWEDLRNGQLLAQQEIPLSPESIPMTSQSEMAPEIGQSLATGLDDAFKTMARKIVNLMEVPW